MQHLLPVICLLPIVFMLHEFEEILFLRPWLDKEKNGLYRRFPRSEKIIRHLDKLSPRAFTLAVAEEFAIVGAATILAITPHFYYAWIAVLLAFSLHIVVHIVQWLIIRHYIPAIVTSILVLPYCIYGCMQISTTFSPAEILSCLTVGIVFMTGNLLLIHKAATLLDKKFRPLPGR